MACQSVWPPAALLAQQTPAIAAARVHSTPPKIDGNLDDAVWEQATVVTSFLQRDPVEGAPASERTEVRLLFDDEQLYVAFRCLESEPDRIVASHMRRDADLGDDDNVVLVLDTYNDGRSGFYFGTNPYGAQREARLSNEGRNSNEAWDCVWACKARRDSAGWSAEMAIPFDQLRYAEQDETVWGINLGRTIRRKNEEVFLSPSPQEYGFGGAYRTSRLATLHGLGALRATTPFEIVPYAQTASERDLSALDTGVSNEFNSGFDLKYGLTPSLTSDFTYKTDFGQVEADQEQVNLTRFSLFFPEKRGFFLEGASVFDFGERVSRRGGSISPATLLFYSRRIGIQDGHDLPVLFGSKVTGRLGAWELGLLNMTTEAATFVDEEEEERFVTDSGLLLDDEDDRLAGSIILDTVDVDVLDTLDAKRANFSVIRVRRDVLARSSVGIIALNRDPGEESGYIRALGADMNLSLLDAALNVRSFLARTWSPDLEGEDMAGLVSLEHRAGDTETQLSYLDVQENFNPEIGFVPRDDSRRIKTAFRYRPRPSTPWIRQLSFGPRLTYLMDQGGTLQSRDLEFSFFTNLEVGDWIGLRLRDRFERLDEPFDIHEEIEVPAGDHRFTSIGLNLFPNDSRRISGDASAETGQFFNGTRHRLSTGVGLKVNGRLTVETDYEVNRVNLPAGDFTTNRLSNRLLYSFSPDFFVRGLVQWNSKDELVGGNFLLNYRYRPGSDLFLVYNQAWDTEGSLHQRSRSLQVKVAHFWNR
ncbi:MAG: DUF5916 domain-containing protein [Candidatus Latescibacteria bacterium]|nr:DUF5916 domain-containing protein [Candidatus Latescibacterota bacterium]